MGGKLEQVREDNALRHKGLSHEDNVRVKTEIVITETEKKLLDGVASRFPSHRGPKGPSVAQALVYLVRIAFQCLQHHYEAEPLEPKKIGPKTLEKFLDRHSATVVHKRSLDKPRILTTNPDGSKTWDDYE